MDEWYNLLDKISSYSAEGSSPGRKPLELLVTNIHDNGGGGCVCQVKGIQEGHCQHPLCDDNIESHERFFIMLLLFLVTLATLAVVHDFISLLLLR